MRAFVRQVDTKLTQSITNLPISLRPFFVFITSLGHPVVPIIIGTSIAIIGMAQAKVDIVWAGVAIWLTLGIGSLLKLLFKRARPLTDYAANIWLDRLSFPSGHTTGSTIAYGILAYFTWQLLTQPWDYIAATLLTVLVALIGISRVYLGAHFPSDVIAGWILGSVALAVVVLYIQPLG